MSVRQGLNLAQLRSQQHFAQRIDIFLQTPEKSRIDTGYHGDCSHGELNRIYPS